jgi:Family of unknown function (DUF6025)
MTRNAVELVERLGVGRDGLSKQHFRDFAERRSSFDAIHLGTTDIPVGRLMEVLLDAVPLRPPRTGHLGNWEDISRGRAGPMDFNQTICARKLGYPLIYCFNQTEDESLSSGDSIYLPGSIVENGQRYILPLSTWNGRRFERRTRKLPLFVPLVWTEFQDQLLPLTRLHWQRMQTVKQFEFQLEAQLIYDHRDQILPMLVALIDEAILRPNSRRALQDLISHAVSLDGRMKRAFVAQGNSGYWLNETYFPSTEALARAMLQLFEAAIEPEQFFDDIAKMPAQLPVMSNILVGVFSAIFFSHYPGIEIDRPTMTQPFNPHFHWGARDMAGFPPRRSGYFMARASTRSIRQICDTLLRGFSQIDPVYFLLMPAAIFMLCPPDVFVKDSETLSVLFQRVRKATAHTDPGSTPAVDETDGLVRDWLSEFGSSVSPYFLNRFRPGQGILQKVERPLESVASEPDGFRDLTLRQSCQLVGSLVEAIRT